MRTTTNTRSHKLDGMVVEFPLQPKLQRVHLYLHWRSHDTRHQSQQQTDIRQYFFFQAHADHRQNSTSSNSSVTKPNCQKATEGQSCQEKNEWLRLTSCFWCNATLSTTCVHPKPQITNMKYQFMGKLFPLVCFHMSNLLYIKFNLMPFTMLHRWLMNNQPLY